MLNTPFSSMNTGFGTYIIIVRVEFVQIYVIGTRGESASLSGVSSGAGKGFTLQLPSVMCAVDFESLCLRRHYNQLKKLKAE